MLTLSNPRSEKIQPVETAALADTGSVYLVIPEHVRLQLQLEEQSRKEITLADGSKKMIPYVGPIVNQVQKQIGLRRCDCDGR